MVMAPGGNLGGDQGAIAYPRPQSFRQNFAVGTIGLGNAVFTTVLTSRILQAGTYLVMGAICVTCVTATDEAIVQIVGSGGGAGVTASQSVPVSAVGYNVPVSGILVLTAPQAILLRGQGSATANLTANATDPATNNFAATYLTVVPIG